MFRLIFIFKILFLHISEKQFYFILFIFHFHFSKFATLCLLQCLLFCIFFYIFHFVALSLFIWSENGRDCRANGSASFFDWIKAVIEEFEWCCRRNHNAKQLSGRLYIIVLTPSEEWVTPTRNDGHKLICLFIYLYLFLNIALALRFIFFLFVI